MSEKTLFNIRNVFLYAPVLVWMVGIFYLSSIPGSGVAYEMPTTLLIERKGAHMFEYFVLTFLFLRIFSALIPRNRSRVVWLSAAFALTYAISDEIHQLFVFARTGKVTDVCIDSIGIVLAVLLFLRFSHFQALPLKKKSKGSPKGKLSRKKKKTTIKKKK